jgi:hypothetical protein
MDAAWCFGSARIVIAASAKERLESAGAHVKQPLRPSLHERFFFSPPMSPVPSDLTMLLKIVSTMTSDSLRASSTAKETSSIKSAFVIVCAALFGGIWTRAIRI